MKLRSHNILSLFSNSRNGNLRMLIATYCTRSIDNYRRRVVVTGLGIVCPLGVGVDVVWSKLLDGRCGFVNTQGPEYESIPCKVVGYVPTGTENGEYDEKNHVTPSEVKSSTRATHFALTATEEALTQARWKPGDARDKERTGIAIGMGMAGLQDIVDTGHILRTKGYRRVSPYFVPRILPNLATGHVSIRYGFQGPNHCVSTACTTGAHAIGDAMRFIRNGDADVMVAGGSEACITPVAMAGFARARALSTKYNNTPHLASRPFDEDRDGFVMSEGAAILLLEEWEHAHKRGAEILAEVLGYGLSGDASHITAPTEDGRGAELCMKAALRDARITPEEVTYINAHATSTPLGDEIENRAIKRVFGPHSYKMGVSSTKGSTGHLLGAAGALEAAFTVLACKSCQMPPTINLSKTSEELDLNYIPQHPEQWDTPESGARIALTNSFGFGGTNASLCIASV